MSYCNNSYSVHSSSNSYSVHSSSNSYSIHSSNNSYSIHSSDNLYSEAPALEPPCFEARNVAIYTCPYMYMYVYIYMYIYIDRYIRTLAAALLLCWCPHFCSCQR